MPFRQNFFMAFLLCEKKNQARDKDLATRPNARAEGAPTNEARREPIGTRLQPLVGRPMLTVDRLLLEPVFAATISDVVANLRVGIELGLVYEIASNLRESPCSTKEPGCSMIGATL
jgi:hypothetical protein